MTRSAPRASAGLLHSESAPPVRDSSGFRHSAIAAMVVSVMGLSLFATDVFVPGLPAMASEFDVDASQAQLTIGLFVLSFALGQLVFGPLSDRYGRRRVMLASLALLAASSLACALAPSFGLLLAGRCLQALGACAGSVLGRAILSDCFDGTGLLKVLSTTVIVKALAPAIAPVIGGFIVPHFGWQATFALMAVLSLGVLSLSWRYLPETNRNRDPLALGAGRLTTVYLQILRNREFLRYTIAPALLNGGLVAIISNIPFILMTSFHVSKQQYGALQALHAGLFVAGALAARLSARWLSGRARAEATIGGVLAAFVVLVAVLACLLGKHISMATTLSVTLLYCLAMGYAGPFLSARAIESFVGNAGANASMQGFIYYGVGGLVGVCSYFLVATTPAVLCGILAGCGLCALAVLAALGRAEDAQAAD